jgi:hypothetical protein
VLRTSFIYSVVNQPAQSTKGRSGLIGLSRPNSKPSTWSGLPEVGVLITVGYEHPVSFESATDRVLDASEIDRNRLDRGQRQDSRKEVIQPQVPLRLPCYDFTPVTSHSLGGCLRGWRTDF